VFFLADMPEAEPRQHNRDLVVRVTIVELLVVCALSPVALPTDHGHFDMRRSLRRHADYSCGRLRKIDDATRDVRSAVIDAYID
jgi:hypothetical protein